MIKFAVFIADLKKTSQVDESSDTLAPSTPRIDSISEFTNNADLEIVGYTESGAIVTIYYNNKNEETVANNEGGFRFKISLKEGLNTFSFISKDSSGNESPRSKTQTVTYDKTPPSLDIKSPPDNGNVYGDINKNLEITGTTDPEIKIYANDRLTSSDENGNFKIRVYLSEGANSITLKAVDNAQNETEKSLTINFYP